MAEEYKRIEWTLDVTVVDPETDAPKIKLEKEKIPINFYGKGGNGRLIKRGESATIPLINTKQVGDLRFLLIRATSYASVEAEPDEKIRYAVDNDPSDKKLMITGDYGDHELGDETKKMKSIPLDGPQLFTNGAANWFSQRPNYLHVTNGTEEDITIEVLVGRYESPASSGD